MILFIDVISPAPKFVITDNNKVIESLHILEPNCTKISDNIHASFLNLERKYNLLNLLEHLVVCIGPGSYTSLRVGISFMFGISFSKKIPIYGLSCNELLSQFIMLKDFYNTFIIICSSNNQNFVLLPINHKNYQYNILKISDKSSFSKINLKIYTKCVSNYILPDFLNNEVFSNLVKLEYINFEDKLSNKYLKTLRYKDILKPIYISDNKLFD